MSKLGYAGKLFLVEISNLTHQLLIFCGTEKGRGWVGWVEGQRDVTR